MSPLAEPIRLVMMICLALVTFIVTLIAVIASLLSPEPDEEDWPIDRRPTIPPGDQMMMDTIDYDSPLYPVAFVDISPNAADTRCWPAFIASLVIELKNWSRPSDFERVDRRSQSRPDIYILATPTAGPNVLEQGGHGSVPGLFEGARRKTQYASSDVHFTGGA
jgi:hypothetical protein